MMSEAVFQKLVKDNFEMLDLYTTAITRAHGKSHPETFKVRDIFEVIQARVVEAGESTPNLVNTFKQLQEITDNYKIPHDVCQTYANTYEMLLELNKAYEA